MIIHTLCNACLQAYELWVESGDIGLMKQLVPDGQVPMCPCPRLCGGQILLGENPLVGDPRLRTPLKISVKELFKAVKGAGLPDEVPKSADLIQALFKGYNVTGIKVEQVGDEVYLHEVMFENGNTVHLGYGPKGARIFKITREKT